MSKRSQMQRQQDRIAELRRRSTCSVDEAARLLQIGRSTAYAAAKDGSLPTHPRLVGRILVPDREAARHDRRRGGGVSVLRVAGR